MTEAWLGRLEATLAASAAKKGAYLTGAAFTPADAAVYVALVNGKTSIDGGKFPKLAQFVAAVTKRPNIAK